MNPLQPLEKYSIVLASASPRRRELLGMLGLPFTVAPKTDVDESYPTDLPAAEVAPYLARLKSDAWPPATGQMVITADTVVIAADGTILGKPSGEADARSMLRRLAGGPHTVVTGVAVATTVRREIISCSTDVYFGHLTQEEIDYYISRFTPLDKAGAYGIQEWIGAAAVERIDGSFYNVMGLPVHALYTLLRDKFL